jgi:GDP-L-fucose synthase
MHSDDLARALVFLMRHYSEEQFINVGTGVEITIHDLAAHVARAVGYVGETVWDTAKPDGTPRKLMDNSRLSALGWKPEIDLSAGIAHAYADFCRRFAV